MTETRYLISVGINDYDPNSLDYCVKDSEDIVHLFQTYCRVKESNCFNITSNTNKPNHNVYESIVTAFKRIESIFVQNNDSIFFYFSGHGNKSNKSTALVLHNKILELQDIFVMLSSLKPKFIFCLIDSCFSGVGIEDEIMKSSNDILFSQHLKIAGGYNIICACANDSTAKEDPNYKNGRLTRIFIDIIQNKLHYQNGILNLSKVFQLIDESFKKNPHFRQFPFTQYKGLSTYPIALLPNSGAIPSFSTHYVGDIETYDWENFKNELLQYCRLKKELVIEFTRLVREILRNCKTWSNATFLKIEISEKCVCLYDNSGTYFDIFKPKPGLNIKGGGITAKNFKNSFKNEFTYHHKIKSGETIQIFSFMKSKENKNVCMYKFADTFILWEFIKNQPFIIPDYCEDYKFSIPRGTIDLSSIYGFLKIIIKASKQSNKPVIITIDDLDLLKGEFVRVLKELEKSLGDFNVVIK